MRSAAINTAPGVPPRGTAVLDMAVGILMVGTGVDPLTARTDLVATARTGRVDVVDLAAAIVGLCAGLTGGLDHDAVDVVLDRWGAQLTQART